MKYVCLCIVLIFSLLNDAFGTEPRLRMVVQGESIEHGSASTIGLYLGDDILYAGLSFNHIESSRVIQYSDRKTIYPVYVAFGLKAPWRVAPYIEAGFDLGDSILNDLFDNEDDDNDLVDYYYAGGVMFPLSEKMSLAVYAKRYNLIFRRTISSPTIKRRPYGYGLGLSVKF